jgi:hypothetical protein
MEAIKTLKTKNKVLKIYQEEQPESPREWDNMGTMLCTHKRYNLGDEKENKEFDFDQYNNWDEVKEAIMKENNVAVILPLFLYDHSGITMKTTPFGDRWDSGQVGFVYVTKEKLKEEYSVKRITKKLLQKATEILINEVKTYDQYLVGDIYSFTVSALSKCNEGHEHENVIDSCGGFYGSDFATNGITDHIGDTDLIELLKNS